MIPSSWHAEEPPAGEQMILAVEDAIGSRYPSDFRAVAGTIHGATTPRDSAFKFTHPRRGRMTGGFDQILSLDPDSIYYVGKTIAALRTERILPVGVVPFAMDAGGDLVAFDTRISPPSIVYVATSAANEDDETHIFHVTDSFTSFLHMLEP